MHNGDAAALRQFLGFLRQHDVIPAEKVAPRRLTPVEQEARAFEHYLRDERALARATCVNYVPFIRGFLTDRFGRGPVTLSRLCAGDVVRFVQRQAPRLHLKRAKLLTSALRSFLQYARYRGAVTLDLAAAVPVVANWSMPSIPRAIGADQVRQLLASIDRRTATGRRDYAIVLLLARLGLRSGEVAFLELDDHGLERRPGERPRERRSTHRASPPGGGRRGDRGVPAPRAPAQHAAVACFCAARLPSAAFCSQCAIGSIIRHALQRADIQAPTTGAHQFRHALATQMLRRGASLTEIGEVLRHRSPQTTMIYAKVDLTALRTLALPWPGGAR